MSSREVAQKGRADVDGLPMTFEVSRQSTALKDLFGSREARVISGQLLVPVVGVAFIGPPRIASAIAVCTT